MTENESRNRGRHKKEKEYRKSKIIHAEKWDEKVEELFRLQSTGWKTLQEYISAHGKPLRWRNSFIKCLRTKADGYYTYWDVERECEDKYIHRVKIYS